ncbi:MAG TPA: hypothetical protein VGF52_06880 [Tepidisphaeraceae bacterium]|jgi:hypothetical protein
MTAACAAPAATLPMEIRTTINGVSAKPIIQTFLDKQVVGLSSSVPAQQTIAREAIAAEVVPPVNPADPPLSPVFLDLYAGILNDDLMPLGKNPDPRVRLNAAIVAAKVAAKAGNVRLEPLVSDLLADQSDAVVLWAVKACKFLLPQILANAVMAPNDQLMTTFLKTVQQHGKSAPIVHAAYDALRVDSTTVPPAAWNQVVPATVTAAQTLLENRISAYHASIPPQPGDDAIATTFLSDAQIWQAQSKDQQLRSVQDISDLLSVVAQRWENATPGERLDLAKLTKDAGGAVWVVGQNTGNADLQRAEEQLKVAPSMSSAQVSAQVEAIRTAIKSVPDFSGLKDAPALEPIATSSPATSEPSSPSTP